jgi:flagellar biosynthesis GTPase FlhF
VTEGADGISFDIAPEERARVAAKGEIGFMEQLRRTDKTELIPFNPESVVKSIELLDAVNRLRNDSAKAENRVDNFLEGSLRFGGPIAGISSAMQTPLSAKERRQKDIEIVGRALQSYEEEAIRGRTIGAKITEGVLHLPGFMVEFLATGGLASIGKQGTFRLMEKAAGEVVKKGALNFTTRAVGTGIGAGFRTAAMPHRVVDNYAKRQLEAGLEVTDKGVKLADEGLEKPHVSALKAFGDVFIENFSEVLGGPGRRITSKFIPKGMKKSFETMYKALGQQQGAARKAADLWTKVGFDGFLEELGEERAGAFLRALTGVEDFGAEDPHNTMDRVFASIPNWEELLVEAGIFAFPMALRTGTAETMNILAKRRGKGKAAEKAKINEVSQLTAEEIAKIGQEGTSEQVKEVEAQIEKAKEEAKKAKEETKAAKEETKAAKEETKAAKEETKAAKEETKAAKEEVKQERKSRKEMLEENRRLKAEETLAKKAAERATEIVADIGHSVDQFLGEISSRVGVISEVLKIRLRRFEFDTMTKIGEQRKQVMPFIMGVAKMTKDDRADMDFALKNGWVKVRDTLLEKYNLKDEYAKVREVLDDLYARSTKAGLKVEYLKNMHPRAIRDIEGLVDFFLENDIDGTLQQAFDLVSNDLGETLNDEQKADLVNSLLRGKKSSTIELTEPSALKDRQIKELTPELNKFYYGSEAALLHYIYSVNTAIETNRFFGRGENENGKNIEDSIGAFVIDLLNKGEISFWQQNELKEILRARFKQRSTHGLMTTFKNISYIDVLGSPIKALTQLGDLALAAYKNGVFNTFMGVFNLQPVDISREDIGVTEIGVEFEEGRASHAFAKKVFDLVGFTAIDTLGKNAVIRGSFLKYKGLAEKGDKEFLARMDLIFGEEAGQVVEDLKNDVTSENVKFLLASDLMDIQPVTLSEMPEKYLTAGNNRIFYMLKSFMIKVLDIYRNDVFKLMRTDPKKAMFNFMNLTAAMIIGGAGPDLLKDLILGRPIDLPDTLVNNILKIVGFNKFLLSKASKEGIGSTLLEMILPPAKSVDAAGKDIRRFLKDGVLPDQWELINSIPAVGELYYWWFGRGRTKIDDKRNGRGRSRAAARSQFARGRSGTKRGPIL